MSQKRDALNAEFNTLAAKAADLRTTPEAAAELAATVAAMKSIESELAVLASRENTPAKVEIVTEKTTTVGEAAVAVGIHKAAVGTSTELSTKDVFTSPLGTAGSQPSAPAMVAPGIAGLASHPTSILDLIPTLPTNTDSVVEYRQTGFVNAVANADALGEYDQSEITWAKVNVPVEKRGTFFVVAEETLADDDRVAALINSEGTRGVREASEAALIAAITGDDDVQTYEKQSSETALVAIRKAITKIETAAHTAEFIAVTPAVKEVIDLSSTPVNGGAGLFAAGASTLFGLPLVVSTRLGAGNLALVGSSQAARIYTRSGVEVSTSNSHNGLFIKDGVAVKVRQRAAVSVTKPEAFCVVTDLV